MSEDSRGIRRALVLAYDRMVDTRDGMEVAAWKTRERERFLQMLKDEGRSRLIDIGSGPGTHAIHFKQNRIQVTCIDLSPENVKRCKAKGLEAFECDVLDLRSLGREFDSAFAMNSLLHVPRGQLREALSAIRWALSSSGLFYWGQYGGEQREGVSEEDEYEPKRFFSFLDDEQIREVATSAFSVEGFTTVALSRVRPLHYQSLILRK